jgi:hypothetical protein
LPYLFNNTLLTPTPPGRAGDAARVGSCGRFSGRDGGGLALALILALALTLATPQGPATPAPAAADAVVMPS